MLFLLGVAFNLIDGIGPTIVPHRNAWRSLRDVASAEADLRSRDRDDNQVNDYWVGDVSQLYLMQGRGEEIRLVELSIVMADASPSASHSHLCSKSGYWFRAMKTDEKGIQYDRGSGRNPDKFGFCAYPERYRSDDLKFTFIVNEKNVVWKKDLGGASVLQWPRDPAAEGWARVTDGTDL